MVVAVMISTLGLDRLSLHQHEPVDFGADGDESSDDDIWEEPVGGDEEEDPTEQQELGNSQPPSESDQGDVNMVADADADAQQLARARALALQPQQPDGDNNNGAVALPAQAAPRKEPPRQDQCTRCRTLRNKTGRREIKKNQLHLKDKDKPKNTNWFSPFRCSDCNNRRMMKPYDCANSKDPVIQCYKWVAEKGAKCSSCQGIDKAAMKNARAAMALKKRAEEALARKEAAERKEERKRLRDARKGKESADKAAARQLASEYREANKQIREKMKPYAEPYDSTKGTAETRERWERDFLERFGSPQDQKATNADGSPVVDNAERPPPAGDPRDDRTKLSKDTIKRYTTGREGYMDVDPDGCCLRKK